jgi:alkaline phosphatase D
VRASVCRVISRRTFVTGVVSAGAVACTRTLIKTRVPAITHGVQSGDPHQGRALVWARCDEPARMLVEWDTSEAFANPQRVQGPVVGPDGDGCGTAVLAGLPDAQTIVYRVRFEREAARGASAWAMGRLVTPGTERVRFAWTGDTCGQGFGRNPEWGGLRGYAAIAAKDPAFLLHSGDLIYADSPIVPELPLADGRVWRNISNEHVARVAESLADFRARFAYNLEDEHVRALAAQMPIIAQWDDHETHNNWWPGQALDDDRYQLRDASALAALARRAMFEWTPLPPGRIHRVIHHGPLLDIVVLDCRSFRTANDGGVATKMLGDAQARWLVDTLTASRARWKVIACDQPLSLVIPDGAAEERFEGWGNTAGPPQGREVELAAILGELQQRGIRDLVWLTADVHYAAAHHYDPSRANGVRFDAFWEFVAGPIHAGTFGPNALDPTFGPEVRFQWAPPPGAGNLAPWDGLQSFGTVDVTRDALTVVLYGIDGHERFRQELA